MAEQTIRQYKLNLFNPYATKGKYQFPELKAEDLDFSKVDNLIGFNFAKTAKNSKVGVHFFIDDYQFNRVWNSPGVYRRMLSKFDFVLTPDFSLYTDMPKAMQIWNVYRSRLLGQFWQNHGIQVIPTVGWSDEASFDFCFDGLPKQATLAISTVGVRYYQETMDLWKAGCDEMIRRLKPTKLLVYGAPISDYQFPKDIEIMWVENENTKRQKAIKKEAKSDEVESAVFWREGRSVQKIKRTKATKTPTTAKV